MKTSPWISGVVLAALCVSQASASAMQVSLAASDPALQCGAAQTPVMQFSGTPPKGTKSYAIIFWDQMPNALSGRWLVFNIPLGTKQLGPVAAAATTVAGGRAATNEAGKQGYSPICKVGSHDIYIDYYALDVASLNLPAGAPLQTLHSAIKRHKLLEAKAHLRWPVQ